MRHASSGSLLDVGTGDGHFLDLARTRFRATGTEISATAGQYARRRGHRVLLGSLDAPCFAEATFDVITLWHVLEHVARPGSMLATARRLLGPGGILVIAVPNEARALATHRLKRLLGLGARWTPFGAIRPAREIHLTQFLPGTLARAVRRAGLTVLESGRG